MEQLFSLTDLVSGRVSPEEVLARDSPKLDLTGFRFAEDGFVRVTRANREVRPVASKLANAGYVTDGIECGIASFVSLKKTYDHWGKWVENWSISECGIVHTYTEPAQTSTDPGLLVVFSSVSDRPNSPDMIRYFNQNFSTIGKFIPRDVGILRLSDIGCMVGAFYMDTLYNPRNESGITKFLDEFIAARGIRKDRVVFYGTSKGGTGAFLHGMKLGVRIVAVDPIVHDQHYLTKMNDAHFVTGVFPEMKEARFSRLVRESASPNATCVISSENSPQFQYIEEIIRPLMSGDRLIFLNSKNPSIKDHPDVGPNTVNAAVMMINMSFYDLGLRGVNKKFF
ncbi:XcbB/CpsF family capsular polysaccharide biosynthesis protein [Methylorubrum extorquens]|uniref:XcbB/CpsF family capsular polysaccharide biosynthesis protein n=1 Tax=Methylorubrum extorquens TaxID=408 RepID=A0AAX3WFU8_METEX|nr:XcbB/CpsF family capsular polysaccharide biosynthesis protein [Methylorubrum extorquens]WHQ69490.1 XcbB/CpsF family capsular polysaccharide biosynthesis protein [Methylorubrum extorquens]